MNLLADINIFPATAINEPEKPHIIELNSGGHIVAPASFPYAIPNVLTALIKRYCLSPEWQKPRLRRFTKSRLNSLIRIFRNHWIFLSD
jgi:hypothetical protein